MMIGRGKLRGFASAALGASLLAAAPAGAAAESTAAFFQGKQVRFYTMGGPGGGYDTYMRALIPHLEKKLGARMLPTNEPGAGGLIAVNRTVNSPADGLVGRRLLGYAELLRDDVGDVGGPVVAERLADRACLLRREGEALAE